MARPRERARLGILLAISLTVASVFIGTPIAAAAPPTFTKVFGPDTIGPGSVSTLTFAITNPEVTVAEDLAFIDGLPAAITIATPANATNSCGGTLTAPDGGGTGNLGANPTGTWSKIWDGNDFGWKGWRTDGISLAFT